MEWAFKSEMESAILYTIILVKAKQGNFEQ